MSLGTFFPQKLVAMPKEMMARLDEWQIIALSNINSKDSSTERSRMAMSSRWAYSPKGRVLTIVLLPPAEFTNVRKSEAKESSRPM